MKNKIAISAVIPAYKCPGVLEKLLVSIVKSRNHVIDEDYEIIVVDDNSKDTTVDIARKYTRNVLVLDKNNGPAYARNCGASVAKGDILLFLDADVIFEQNTLDAVFKFFDKNNGKLCVIGIHPKYPANPSFFSKYMSLYTYYTYSIIKKGNLSSVFTPRCGAIKREIFFSIGGFSSGYKGADVEDYEIAERITKICPIRISKDITVLHHYPDRFVKIIKNYFKRGFLWSLLFFERRRFDNMGATTFSEGITIIYAGLSVIFVIMSFFHILFLLPFFILLLMYCGSSLKFIRFLADEESAVFAVKSLAVKFCFSIVIFVSSVLAGMSYMLGKCCGKR